MAGQYGNKETKEAFVGAAKLFKAFALAKENDGKIDVSDLPLLIDPMIYLPTAISGLSEVPKESSEFDPAETQEILDAVVAEIGPISNEKLKRLVARHGEWVKLTHDIMREFYFPPAEPELR